jgi:hypothetical protein
MNIDEWWDECKENSELRDFLIEVSKEVLQAIDPIPGLTTWLGKHGLGVLPFHREIYEREDDEHEEMLPSLNSFSTSGTPTPKESPSIKIGDRVRYETKGSRTNQIGEGTVVMTMGSEIWINIGTSNSEQLVYANLTTGDELTKVT